jgi:hypothetical protein
VTVFFCLEDNTERSESSPGRSLGWWYGGICGCWLLVLNHQIKDRVRINYQQNTVSLCYGNAQIAGKAQKTDKNILLITRELRKTFNFF